jgi:hypothetical protein
MLEGIAIEPQLGGIDQQANGVRHPHIFKYAEPIECPATVAWHCQ